MGEEGSNFCDFDGGDDRHREIVLVHLPLNSGQSWPSAPIGPRPVYWPTASSMNSIGMPQISRIMKYGTRKTPENWADLGHFCINDVCANEVTSAAFVGQVRKPPNVSEANRVPDAGQHELHLVGPVLLPGLEVVNVRVVRDARVAVILVRFVRGSEKKKVKLEKVRSLYCYLRNQSGIKLD